MHINVTALMLHTGKLTARRHPAPNGKAAALVNMRLALFSEVFIAVPGKTFWSGVIAQQANL
ncbi:hypothetical protein GCM10010981_24290 [Dyella nitratireducens]|uniref:Uncharacterized protein n=1 Tax=Dyella nitratireducens TaxID=1849580 RepID=A0ABQ1G2T4_9GAMM|nr:hypothetical protein GCM10010981_24290 [Dyella nitratireducens]GLQ40863.1 hypothetical protein GCM10007902_07130 [Dyella nitratireducens]